MTSKLCAIGNSKGIRIPQRLIARYHLSDEIVIEEREEGLLVRPAPGRQPLSWEQTFKQMAQEQEDWSDLDETLADGL